MRQGTRSPARMARSNAPPPPTFYQSLVAAGVGGGAATGALLRQGMDVIDIDDEDDALPLGEARQPQGKPEPELPGRSEPSASDWTGTSEGRASDVPDQDSHQEEVLAFESALPHHNKNISHMTERCQEQQSKEHGNNAG